MLELAGVLSWQHRIARIRVRERDLLGQWASRWRVIRTSNAYVFGDPKMAVSGRFASKSENPPGTLNQEIPISGSANATNPDGPLERALQRFGAVIQARLLAKGSGGTAQAV